MALIFAWQDTENRDTFFLTIEGLALDPRLAAATPGRQPMADPAGQPSRKVTRRAKVSHIRFSEGEFSAVEAAAAQAGLSISAFLRSLSLEGAGMQPFLNPADREVMRLLSQDMRAISSSLNLIARAMTAGRSVDTIGLAGAIDDARAVATTVAAELAAMTKQAGAARRREPG